MRSGSVVVSFLLGACTTAAVQSGAAPQPPTTPPERTGAITGSVISWDDAPRRISPSKTGSIRVLAQGDNAFVGRLDLEPGASVPEHRDSTEEYIVVLQGSGVLTMDGHAHQVEPGTTVYMPADAVVSFQNGDEPLVAIQVFATPEPAAKYDAWSPAD